MALKENQLKDIIATALTKAWEEENFKEKLLAAPIDTIEKLTGERLSFKEGFKMSVIELPRPDAFNLDIPSYVGLNDTELTEEELDFAAGGTKGDFKSLEDFTLFLKSYL